MKKIKYKNNLNSNVNNKSLKKIYYSIDIGAPSKKGGFYSWRFEPGYIIMPIDEKESITRWKKTLENIQKDLKISEVVIAIEAPLLLVVNTDEIWESSRFILDGKYIEYPFYVSAGASAGLVAQVFLNELIDIIGVKQAKKITLIETYVSGFKGSHSKIDFGISKINSHKFDSFEGMMMLLDHLNLKDEVRDLTLNAKKYFKKLNCLRAIKHLEKGKKTDLNLDIVGEEKKCKPIGIVKAFNFEKKILISRRVSAM